MIETSQIEISDYRNNISAFLLAILIMCKSIRVNAGNRVSYLNDFRQRVLRKSELKVGCRVNKYMEINRC